MHGDGESSDSDDECAIMLDNLESWAPPKNENGLRFSNSIEELNEYLSKHPAFIDHEPTAEEVENNELLQALQTLKYEEDDPLTYSESLKEEGNHYFKQKKYKEAITSYTAAIKELERVEDINETKRCLEPIFLTNRAACQYYLGNKRKAMIDARAALKLNPAHWKAANRLCQCFYELCYYQQCIELCDYVTANNKEMTKDPKMLQFRTDALTKLKEKQRNERKLAVREKKLSGIEQNIRSRGIVMLNKISRDEDPSKLALPTLELISDKYTSISYPVTFFYPQYMQCDFISHFSEDYSFLDQLNAMFEEPAPWDVDGSHRPDNFVIYYEDLSITKKVGSPKNKAIRIKSWSLTLKQVLNQQKVIEDCHLNYFLLPKSNQNLITAFEGSLPKFKEEFKKKLYSI